MAGVAKYGGGDWVKMGDVQAFAEKLRTYANKPEMLNEMGKRGRRAILQNFTAKKAAETVLTEMSRLAAKAE